MWETERQLDLERCLPIRFSAVRYEKEPILVVSLFDVVRGGLVECAVFMISDHFYRECPLKLGLRPKNGKRVVK
jgi:hypothetical protein